MGSTAWRWTALIAWMVVYLSDASVGIGEGKAAEAAEAKGAQEAAAPVPLTRETVEKVVRIGYLAGYHEGVKQGCTSAKNKGATQEQDKQDKGDEEEEEKHGTGVLTTPDDFANCSSEGGPWQCASCREENGTGGALPCDSQAQHESYSSDTYSSCPDSLVNGKVFLVGGKSGENYGQCKTLFDAHQAELMAADSFSFGSTQWGKAGTGYIEKVLQKTQVGHPQRASPQEGYVMFKRIVFHKTKTNETKADVVKVGYCVRCPLIPVEKFKNCPTKKGKQLGETKGTKKGTKVSKKGEESGQGTNERKQKEEEDSCMDDTESAQYFSAKGITIKGKQGEESYNKATAIAAGLLTSDGKNRSVFHSNVLRDATDIEKRVFVEECFVNAFDEQGAIKEAYACSTSIPKSDNDTPRNFKTVKTGDEAFTNVLAAF